VLQAGGEVLLSSQLSCLGWLLLLLFVLDGTAVSW
jgi:hypothetical protein